MLKFKILIIFCLSCNTIFAQKLVFKVIACNYYANQPKSNSPTTDLVGRDFSNLETIKLLPNSYLCLMHTNGCTIEIFGEGEYEISALEAELLENKKDKPYINYQIGKPDKLPDDRFKNMYYPVCRCIRHHFLDVNLPDATRLYNLKKILITWRKHNLDTIYKLNVRNDFDEILDNLELKDTFKLFSIEKYSGLYKINTSDISSLLIYPFE